MKMASIKRILYLQASPRKKDSFTIRVCDFFLENMLKYIPSVNIETLDLFRLPLPAFTGIHEDSKSEQADEAYSLPQNVKPFVEQFARADMYLLAVPMWNLSVPYPLKHYFDLIVQSGYTVNFTESGCEGLLKDKIMVSVLARGAKFPKDSPFDFHKPFIERFFNFIGVTDIHSLLLEPTVGPEASGVLQEGLNSAKLLAQKICG